MKMENIFFSICIPTYNRAKLLKNTLLAVAPQVDIFEKYCELIISDNASEDDTQEVVSEIQKKYNAVKYFRNSHNLGGRQNIWKVTTYSTGQYIWLLGDDDMPTPGAIEHILKVLQDAKTPENLKLLVLNSMKIREGFSKSSISWGESFAFHSLNEDSYFELGLEILNNFPIKELGFISALVFERESWLNSSYQNYPKKWMYAHLAPLVEIASSGNACYSPRICTLGLPSDQSWCLDRGVFSYCYEFPYCYQLAVINGFSEKKANKLLARMWWRTVQQYIKMLIFSDLYKPSIFEIKQYHKQFAYFWLIIFPIHYLFQVKLVAMVITQIVYFIKPKFLVPRKTIDFEV
jgi:glycosyltransferase involved in cell wall biosynthesis